MIRLFRLVLIAVCLLTLALGGLAAFVHSDIRRPISHSKSDTYIEIPRGSSPSEIAAKLSSAGVIRRGWTFLLYLKATGQAKDLKAGEYRFPTPISPQTVIRKLREGEQRLARFTVIEGWTRYDIAEAMTRIPELKLNGPDDALRLMDDTTLLGGDTNGISNLEGYLFPDTYSFPPDSNSRAMIVGMVKRFKQEWKPEWDAKAADLGYTRHQIVTIASLIETEAKLKEERPIIASVIYNRLKKGIPLGVDSAIVYASKLAGKWRDDGRVYRSDLDRPSPYNTRLNVGLPPGPVGSPGLSSLEAALNPASSDFIYYVREPTRDDGAHNFYNNASDFERGVQRLREWEKTRAAQSPSPNGLSR